MTTAFTKAVTSALLEFAKNCKNILETDKEVNTWLGIPKGKQGKSTYYIPDVHYVTKKGVLIFQICDSQANSPKQIAGDYFTALLSQEVKKIYFVSPDDKELEVKNALFVYHSILKHKFKLKDHQLTPFEVISVQKNKVSQLNNKLIPIAKKDFWGYTVKNDKRKKTKSRK
jgi:hypothetical protein